MKKRITKKKKALALKNTGNKKNIPFTPPKPITPKPPHQPVVPSSASIEETRKKFLYHKAEIAADIALNKAKKGSDPIAIRVRAYADTIWPESIRTG